VAHARRIAEVTVEADTYQITVEPGITITMPAPPAATSGGTKPPTTTDASGARGALIRSPQQAMTVKISR
jgi:hypothetical protein